MIQEKKKLSVNEAFMRLSYLCSTTEYCIADMRKKMTKWELPEGGEDEVLSRLQKERYIDESRYAHAFVRDKYRYNHWGKMRIEMELRQKGISKSNIDEAMEEIEGDEYLDNLKRLIQNKRRTIKGKSDYELNMKLMRFAVSKGYNLDDVKKCLDTTISEPDDQIFF